MNEKPTFGLDIDTIRADFPILSTEMDGNQLIYFDNAASTQKPQAVIDAITDFYTKGYANIHRGNYTLSRNATEAYEAARKTVAEFINAPTEDEIVFTRNATEASNIIASCWARYHLHEGDEILITVMEHHANIVPWQLIAGRTGASLRVVPINEEGEVRLDVFDEMLSSRTKLFATCHVSNALGTINPVKEMVAKAKEVGAMTMIDGAQAIPHMPIDVQDIGCDFYIFSGHKLYGPTGIGVLWGHKNILDAMHPYQAGGDMIQSVSFEKTTFKDAPARFEAGTPNVAGAIGLAAAMDYLSKHDREKLAQYEDALYNYAAVRMGEIEGLDLMGKATHRASVLSFHMPVAHHQDISDILDSENIAVRTGHHCAEPLMRYLALPGTARASLTFYNTYDEVDRFVEVLKKADKMLG